jgi:CII-binding regulator of phage lambda lysogenization HflD
VRVSTEPLDSSVKSIERKTSKNKQSTNAITSRIKALDRSLKSISDLNSNTKSYDTLPPKAVSNNIFI